jgi:hypothetical protein
LVAARSFAVMAARDTTTMVPDSPVLERRRVYLERSAHRTRAAALRARLARLQAEAAQTAAGLRELEGGARSAAGQRGASYSARQGQAEGAVAARGRSSWPPPPLHGRGTTPRHGAAPHHSQRVVPGAGGGPASVSGPEVSQRPLQRALRTPAPPETPPPSYESARRHAARARE